MQAASRRSYVFVLALWGAAGLLAALGDDAAPSAAALPGGPGAGAPCASLGEVGLGGVLSVARASVGGGTLALAVPFAALLLATAWGWARGRARAGAARR